VVANPANMGFLKAVGGVIEGSWARATSQRRGTGVGVFLAVPVAGPCDAAQLWYRM
jgi:hypothetical protein